MPASSLLGFWITALLLIAVPGPDWALTLDAALRRHVLAAVTGLAAGYLLLTALVAVGVGALVVSSPGALSAVTVVGGAYLVAHGIGMCRRPPMVAVGSSARASSARRTFARGVGVSGLNPKGLLLLVSLLPQFTSAGAVWPVAAQTAALGLVFVVSCALFYLALGVLAGRSSTSYPAVGRLLGRVAGIGMVAVGAALITERLGS